MALNKVKAGCQVTVATVGCLPLMRPPIAKRQTGRSTGRGGTHGRKDDTSRRCCIIPNITESFPLLTPESEHPHGLWHA